MIIYFLFPHITSFCFFFFPFVGSFVSVISFLTFDLWLEKGKLPHPHPSLSSERHCQSQPGFYSYWPRFRECRCNPSSDYKWWWVVPGMSASTEQSCWHNADSLPWVQTCQAVVFLILVLQPSPPLHSLCKMGRPLWHAEFQFPQKQMRRSGSICQDPLQSHSDLWPADVSVSFIPYHSANEKVDFPTFQMSKSKVPDWKSRAIRWQGLSHLAQHPPLTACRESSRSGIWSNEHKQVPLGPPCKSDFHLFIFTLWYLKTKTHTCVMHS